MINDPSDPKYRYPTVGERYYHRHWNAWCVVITPPTRTVGLYSTVDEVPVEFDDGHEAIVKLRSLDPTT